MNVECPPLNAVLVLGERKNVLIEEWLDKILATYSGPTSRSLSEEKDRFLNPVGHTFREGLSALFDGLIQPTDMAALAPVLDGIVRIRAVQDFAARQAEGLRFHSEAGRQARTEIKHYGVC